MDLILFQLRKTEQIVGKFVKYLVDLFFVDLRKTKLIFDKLMKYQMDVLVNFRKKTNKRTNKKQSTFLVHSGNK